MLIQWENLDQQELNAFWNTHSGSSLQCVSDKTGWNVAICFILHSLEVQGKLRPEQVNQQSGEAAPVEEKCLEARKIPRKLGIGDVFILPGWQTTSNFSLHHFPSITTLVRHLTGSHFMANIFWHSIRSGERAIDQVVNVIKLLILIRFAIIWWIITPN